MNSYVPSLALLALLPACRLTDEGLVAKPSLPVIAGLERVDHLIQPEERHFARLWQLTAGGENAEGYWSSTSDRLVFQAKNEEAGVLCDRIYVTPAPGGSDAPLQVSSGRGVTTCAYFLPGDEAVVYATTQAHHDACPPTPGREEGYVWPIHPQFDLVARNLRSGDDVVLDANWGYDAEATVSPRGDRLVWTSTRSGDLELWTAALVDGGRALADLRQVTDAPGYDGGAFFSHDGERLVFRATAFTPGKEAEELADYRRLFGKWLVRPSAMELYVVDVDGTDRRQVTSLGGANWAPYFFPDDSRLIFCTNHHGSPREFDLFAVDVDGTNLERITTYEGFDSFPMFSPDGRWLAFASNRGGSKPGETNLFVAEWRP